MATRTESMFFLLFGAFLGLCVSGFSQQHTQGLDSTVAISGTVVDGSGLGLPGVSVQLVATSHNVRFSVITDDSGRYDFKCLPDGVYDMMFRREGFLTHRVEGMLYEYPDAIEYDECLFVAYHGASYIPVVTLVVTVTDSLTGEPLANSVVRVNGEEQRTDTCGRVAFLIDPGDSRVSIEVEKKGYVETRRSVAVESARVAVETPLARE